MNERINVTQHAMGHIAYYRYSISTHGQVTHTNDKMIYPTRKKAYQAGLAHLAHIAWLEFRYEAIEKPATKLVDTLSKLMPPRPKRKP